MLRGPNRLVSASEYTVIPIGVATPRSTSSTRRSVWGAPAAGSRRRRRPKASAAGRQHQRRRDHHERGVPGHHVEIHERPARERGEHGVLERAKRHRGHERDLLRRVLVALVEERRDPGQVGQRDGHVGDQQLAEALAVRHQRPDRLCGHHEHAGVVGVEHERGAGGVQHQPAAAPGVQRDQERQRGEDARRTSASRRRGPRCRRTRRTGRWPPPRPRTGPHAG